MTFNFDMARIGQTIARLRREHNMTQMALADAMGVSFQAVSNWERGQSMPDISKLPELAELFGTTIDDLLGCHSPLIEKAAEGKLEELPTPTVEEVAEAAPLLPPAQIDDLTDRLLELPNLPDMTELLPFLPTAQVDQFLRKKVSTDESIADCLPFASTAAVDEIALGRLQTEESLDQLLPFMSQKAIDNLARIRESSDQSTDFLLPFMSYAALNDVTLARLKAGKSISDLLPFLNQDMLQKLFNATTSTKD